MSRHALHAVLAAAVLALCCGRITQKGATKESVTALLQNEAAAMKRDGEKLDPSIGINSHTEDPTGPVETNFERTFNYVYDAKLGKWLFKP